MRPSVQSRSHQPRATIYSKTHYEEMRCGAPSLSPACSAGPCGPCGPWCGPRALSSPRGAPSCHWSHAGSLSLGTTDISGWLIPCVRAAPLNATHWMPAAPPPQVVTIKNVSCHCKMSPGTESPRLGTMGLDDRKHPRWGSRTSHKCADQRS